jgi:ABC-type amino acid transport substrate-binding protein
VQARAHSIARQLNVGELKINWVPVTIQTRFEAVAKGQADMECGSSTVTLEEGVELVLDELRQNCQCWPRCAR